MSAPTYIHVDRTPVARTYLLERTARMRIAAIACSHDHAPDGRRKAACRWTFGHNSHTIWYSLCSEATMRKRYRYPPLRVQGRNLRVVGVVDGFALLKNPVTDPAPATTAPCV